MQGFKAFLLRGNVIDLAIAVVIGVAFTSVVTAFVKDLLTPLIGAIGGQPDFSSLSFEINNSRFLYGEFINAVLSFVIIAAIIYFLVVKPVTMVLERTRRTQPATRTTKPCPECLSEIPLAARRCSFCGEPVALSV